MSETYKVAKYENVSGHETRLDTLEAGSATEGSVAKTVKDAVDPVKGTNWAGQTVKGNADAIALRELLSNKKTTLADNSDTYFPTQKAVNDGLATKTSKSQIAYDNDATAFIANTLASGAIIERGSNVNGSYTKYADGTMICTYLLDTKTPATFGSGMGGYAHQYGQWTFPAAFEGKAVVLGNCGLRGTRNDIFFDEYGFVSSRASGSNTKSESLVLVTQAQETYAYMITRLSLIAIGRWK